MELFLLWSFNMGVYGARLKWMFTLTSLHKPQCCSGWPSLQPCLQHGWNYLHSVCKALSDTICAVGLWNEEVCISGFHGEEIQVCLTLWRVSAAGFGAGAGFRTQFAVGAWKTLNDDELPFNESFALMQLVTRINVSNLLAEQDVKSVSGQPQHERKPWYKRMEMWWGRGTADLNCRSSLLSLLHLLSETTWRLVGWEAKPGQGSKIFSPKAVFRKWKSESNIIDPLLCV